MNKSIFKYMIISLVVSIGFFIAIQLNSIEDVQSGMTSTSASTTEEVIDIRAKPISLVGNPQTTVLTTVTPLEPKDTHTDEEHESEFYTEMMPNNREVNVPSVFSQPRGDDKKLGLLLDSELLPVFDDAGNFSGLKISGLSSEIEESSMKIKNGDIITKINGMDMINEESLGTVIEQMLSQGPGESTIVFDIDRKGISHSISLKTEL